MLTTYHTILVYICVFEGSVTGAFCSVTESIRGEGILDWVGVTCRDATILWSTTNITKIKLKCIKYTTM